MSKKKKFIPSPSHPNPINKIPKKKKNIKSQKIQKHHSCFISFQNGTRDAENEKKKKNRSESVPTQPDLENNKK